jgi:radical SAM superfamily enzyme YgiQ (UPF0313 family)
MVCIGEGEETIVELADKIQNKQYYYDIKGMAFNDKGRIIVNESRELPGTKKAAIIKSLDQIPFQDYDYRSHFVLNGENIVKMDQKIMEQCSDTYQTLPTRGCPFGCTFCINNFFLAAHPHQKPIRKRSVNNIIMELQEVKSKLPFIDVIMFDDDAFFLMTVDEIKELSKRYKEQIGLPLWITGATPTTLTKEKLSLLVDAGLVEIRMGIQSAAEKAKKLYKRQHSNHRVANAARMINEHRNQLKATYDIILDSPWDTDEDLIENLMFLSKLPTPFKLLIYSLTFYPETDLYKRAEKEGLIKDDVKEYRKEFYYVKKSYLNRLFFLLNDYTSVGIGISPIIMFILTHKMTKKLYLHKFLRNVIRSLLPFFRYIGQSTRRPSTRFYKVGNIIKFGEDKATYLIHELNDFNFGDFHSEVRSVKPPWLIRKFKKMKLLLFKTIYELKSEDIIKKK